MAAVAKRKGMERKKKDMHDSSKWIKLREGERTRGRRLKGGVALSAAAEREKGEEEYLAH